MTITLGPELGTVLRNAARQKGMEPEALAVEVLRERFLPQPLASGRATIGSGNYSG